MGPTSEVSEFIHSTKYRAPGESFEEAMTRVAAALQDNDEHFHTIREILLNMRFMPAGRVQAAIGAPRTVTAYNCFVSGTIGDSMESIMARATEAAQTMRQGGGIGYDFSTLRPRGEIIKSLDSKSSGPISFMGIFNATCDTIRSAGHRRGAQMGVLRVDHPDIEEYIYAKQTPGAFECFNLSIATTDEFMEAVAADKAFDLRWNGKAYKTIRAKYLFEQIMRSTWDYAEPGVLFIDTINKMNNLYYCEEIAATNPCGEQPLPPFGACLLGSFNLAKYIYPKAGRYHFDWDQFVKDIPPIVRMMDNIVDVAIYPLEAQKLEAKSKRRMGLGYAGLANAGEALGFPYASPDFLKFQEQIGRTLFNTAYASSVMIAAEKGSFPLYDAEKYCNGYTIAKLDKSIIDSIKKYGIRNSHLTSIAPTGTISLAADNISSGVEPVYSIEADRKIMTFDGEQVRRVNDYGYEHFNVKPKTAAECTADDHVRALIAASKWVDSAVSKTCNINPKMPWDDFKELYFKAWKAGCKGCTTFNPGGKRMGILQAIENEEQGATCSIDPNTGQRSCE